MAKRSRTEARVQSYSERTVDTRGILPSFLIICEGKKTEPNYFKAFRIPDLSVEQLDVIGLGDNTLSLVERAKERKEQSNYNYVWCVFDRDSFPSGQFNASITSAYNNDIHVAYSNEAFELWYLLHFHFYNTGISRQDYKSKLTKLLKHRYEKNSTTIYEELKENQHSAIKNANTLLVQYDPNRPEKDNPSTTVHLLVQCLNALVECIQKGRKSGDIELLRECLNKYHSQARKNCGIFD
ncbi:RloB family protein [Pseudanabaena sp. BC1403]|uniref:RloB family protein n=1 Tax=Pseudanabaena sp. BC1403 TaxID=2043171 RepID=UPI000CD8FDBE|nr:RloB family protein [Pseudanabaena sp. BC1403]